MIQKRQLTIFTILVLSLSWAYEAYIINNGGVQSFGLLGLVALMWIPGALSILMRLVSKDFKDVGFAIGKVKYYVLAILLPLGLAFLTSAAASLFDIRHFAPIDSEKLQQVMPIIWMSLGFGIFGAFGEELGWRGYLLPKLISSKIPRPYLTSGVIWAAWHLPLIAFGGYYTSNSAGLVSVSYSLSIITIGFVFGKGRMRSGSVWVATLFHAAHNFFFQLAVPNLLFTQQGLRFDLWEIVGGDCGLAVAALYGLVFVIWRKR